MDPIFFGNPSFAPLARALAAYELRSVVECVGGLLTVPEYHPQTIRLEVLLHLACLHCQGRKQPAAGDLRKWLEVYLGDHHVKHYEDPPEDVFVSNVIGPGGNYRIFEGVWMSSHAFVQEVVTCLVRSPSAPRYVELLESVMALLALSDAVAQRSALERWTASTSTTATRFLHGNDPKDLAGRVAFSHSDLSGLGIDLSTINPFLFPSAKRPTLSDEYWGRTSLERHPILPVEGGVIFACPPATSVAIRLYALEWLRDHGALAEFESDLRTLQRDAAFNALENLVETNFVPIGELPQSPSPAAPFPVPVDAAVSAFDVDKRAHVVLVHDRLSAISLRGLTSDRVLPDQGPEPFHKWLTRATETLAADGSGGLVILIHGGLGRGLGMRTPAIPDTWYLVEFTLPDFVTFANAQDATLLRLWKLLEEADRVEEHGVWLQNLSGPLNLLELWASQGFSLIPREFPYPHRPGGIALPTNSVQDFRVREHRLNDVHAAPVDNGTRYTTVRRLVRDSFFQGLAMRPIYVSEEHARQQRLAGIVEGDRAMVWVRTERPEEAPEEVAAFLYNVWDGTLKWIDRAMAGIDANLEAPVPSPVHVLISLTNLSQWREFSRTAGQITPEEPIITADATSSNIRLEIPFGFTAYLRRASNDGERLLLELLCEALLTVLAGAGDGVDEDMRKGTARAIVADAIPDQHARSLHLFSTPDVTDRIEATRRPDPRFVQPEDRAARRTGLGWRVVEQPEDGSGVTITGVPTATQVLNDLVDVIWQDVRERLAEINGPALVEMTLRNNEAAIRDRKWWRRTARALSALFASGEDVQRVAGERENERALVIHAGRILVEMAVPTCPPESGRAPTLTDFDSLIASVATIVDLAADSDAIHGGLAEGAIRIHPDGRVAANRSLIASVANPYAMELHGIGFREAIDSYEELYHRDGNVTPGDGKSAYQTADFAKAFLAEYSIDPDQFIEATAELVDLAVERGTIVTVTSQGEVSERLRTHRRFTASQVDALFNFFALVPRKRWDLAPKGFQTRDWIPWRYRRRLSLVARPLVHFGNGPTSPVLYGANQLALGTSYLLEGIENASLPNEFFTSTEMQRYRGSVAESRGRAFEEEVAAELRRLEWQTLTSVQMTSIGAAAELGDLDVVAWQEEDPRLLLIECKRLQTARGVGEIVERLNQFRGDSKDRLGRHLRRCVELTPFSGHPISSRRKESTDAENETAVPSGVPGADRRAGARRAYA